MKSFNLLNSVQPKETAEPNKRFKLEALKKATKEYIASHNKLVSVLREIEHQIVLLDSTSGSTLKDLNARKTIILACLTRNNSEAIIKQKLKEIESLEHELGNPININSPYSL